MRFSTKIFLTVALASALAVLLTSFAVYEVARNVYEKQYTQTYQHYLDTVARDFVTIERESLKTSLNAARYLRELMEKRRLRKEELKPLANQLGVDDISLVSAEGKFLESSAGPIIQNLFDLCAGYRDLLGGTKAYEHTPLLPDVRDPTVAAWFTMLPVPKSKQIIDIRNTFEELSETLKGAADDDSDIVYVKLRGPSGKVLGEVFKEGYEGYAQGRTIVAKIPALVADCCECRARGLVADSAAYEYEFSTKLTENSLRSAMSALQARFAAISGVLLLLSFGLSYLVSRVLLRKVNVIRDTVGAIASSGDFSRKVPVTGDQKDELNALARQFNDMFDSAHKAQAKLIEAEKSEARAAVAAQVAHDIRSPLTAMTLALNKLQGLVPPAGAEMFSMLSHAVSRVSGIVKRLGSQKTGDAANVIEAPRLTLIDKLFFDVAQEHALKIPKTQKLAINGFAPTPQEWSVVQVAETQTALSNILNNASEAVGEGGEIVLTAERVGKELVLTVADNGKGIPAENLAKIFERGVTMGKATGSGLGLFQAKKAVEWSGGKIEVESTVGKGTKFRLRIPVEKAPAFTVREIELKGKRLIVTDDDPMIISFWKSKVPDLIAFTSFNDLEKALPTLGPLESYVFVLDQYAGDGREGPTGTTFIEKHKIPAYLSTSEFDDPQIQDKIKQLKAKLIPKPQLPLVKVVQE